MAWKHHLVLLPHVIHPSFTPALLCQRVRPTWPMHLSHHRGEQVDVAPDPRLRRVDGLNILRYGLVEVMEGVRPQPQLWLPHVTIRAGVNGVAVNQASVSRISTEVEAQTIGNTWAAYRCGFIPAASWRPTGFFSA